MIQSSQIHIDHKRAVARLITWIENNRPEARPVLNDLYPRTGRAHLVGITGAPGTGKSSLVNELAKAYRQAAQTVAILAVDPTSPFSGGAILGDRIRMRELSGDPGVFVRSMASRGSLGGLARGVYEAVNVFDAAGFDVILIETVGAGQSEVEIARAAHTVIVVEAPGLGDDIQAIKAGILEIADIFVVNKADRPGADKTAAALQTMLELGRPPARRVMHHGTLMQPRVAAGTPSAGDESWRVPVLKTSALKSEGIDAVRQALADHRHYLNRTQELQHRNRARLTDDLEQRLQTELLQRLLRRVTPAYLSDITAKLVNRTLSPYNAVQKILEDYPD